MTTPSNSLEELYREVRERIIPASRKGVFLSYSRKDRDSADRLALGLTSWGFVTWVDRIEIGQDAVSNDDLQSRLRAGIEKADCFLMLLSKHAIQRPWVKWEYEEALRQQRQGKDLLLLHGIVDDCEVPAGWAQTGRIDLRSGFGSAILDIVSHFGITLRAKRDEPFVSAKPHKENLGITMNPAAAVAYNQGVMFYHLGDLESAIKKWERAIEIDGACTDALYNCAVSLYELAMSHKGKPDFGCLIKRAIDQYERVLAVRKDDVDAMVNLAAAYRESGQWRDKPREKELLLKAYFLAPQYGLVWLNMGHFYARNGGVDAIGTFIKSRVAEATITVNVAELAHAKRCFLKAGKLDARISEKSDTGWLARFMDELIELATSRGKRVAD